jgi:UDP-N-acetylmuramate dehydrogenase
MHLSPEPRTPSPESRYKSIDLARLSSIGIGPVTDVYMIDSNDYPSDAYLIGAANNVLFGTELPPLMKLSKTFDFIRIEEGRLHIGAATPGGKIVSFCKKHDIGGFEFLSHLPGTLGGMLKMNAGLKEYEIFNSLVALRTKSGWLQKAQIPHGYRTTGIDEVVFEATFTLQKGFDAAKIDLFKQMRANQPPDPSAGSAFKNPPGDYAGRLIESVGLKGYRVGEMAFSDMHANFLINLGKGNYEEAIALLRLAEKRVLEQHGIALEREIIVIDRRERQSGSRI